MRRKLTLQKEYKWFDRNRKRIVTNHEGEYVLVAGKAMWGYYKDIRTALDDAEKRGFVNGKYMIHECQMEEPVIYMGGFTVADGDMVQKETRLRGRRIIVNENYEISTDPNDYVIATKQSKPIIEPHIYGGISLDR